METNYIKNIDCRQGLSGLPDESIDCVITDVPYHITHHGTTKCGGIFGNNQPNALNGKLFDHNEIEFSEYLPELYRVLKPNTHCYLMINALNLKDLQQAAEDAGFRMQNILVWRKNTATPNQYYMQCLEFILMLRKGAARRVNDCGISNCLSVPNIVGKGDKNEHPTAKPVLLMQVMVEQSTNKGDIVLDPFAGGGSTLVAAKRAERQYIGFEIDKKYFDIAERKLYREPMQATLF